MSSWYLKKADGGIYGPATLSDIRQWAADGRIAPEDDLSEDQASWRPAPSIPEMEMNYEVILEDGSRYGPVHVMALRELMLDGSISAASRILHSVSNTTKSAGEWIIEYLVRQIERVSRGHPATTTSSSEPETNTTPDTPPLPTDPAAKDASSPQDIARWKNLYETEKQLRIDLETKYEQQHHELLDPLRAAQSEKDRLAQQVSDLQTQVDQLRAGSPAGPGESDLQEDYRKLARNYDALLAQLKEKTSELSELREARVHSSDHARVIREMEEQLEGERAQSARTQKRLGQLESDHMELIQSFRDLNDRYIRLRQEHPLEQSSISRSRSKDRDTQATIRNQHGIKPKVRLT